MTGAGNTQNKPGSKEMLISRHKPTTVGHVKGSQQQLTEFPVTKGGHFERQSKRVSGAEEIPISPHRHQ